MANTIKQKRGTTNPGASDLVVGELAINTTDGGVFTKTDGGSVVEVGSVAGSVPLKTAVYEGPGNSTTSATSATYVTVPISTAVGTPDSIYSNASGVVTLGESGTYLCLCTVVVFGTTTSYRYGAELNIRQDTGSGLTEIGSVQGGYIRQSNAHEETYLSISRIVETSDANDTIDFQLRRLTSTAGNGVFVQNRCTIQVIKLDGITGATGATGAAGADGTNGADGADGADGAAATIAVGTVTTGAAGSSATVTNSGTSSAATFDFSIPKGDTGDTGATGAQGPTDIPQNSQTAAYTLVAGDNGKHVNITTGGVTVPSGVFSSGNVVSIFNDSGSDQTITQGSSVTLRRAGTSSTGNRTLSQYGLATVLCVGTNEFVISGAGLS